MLLHDVLATYVATHEYGVSAGHAECMYYSLVVWEKWAARPLTVADLTDETLNGFLDWYRVNRKPDTVRTRRGNLLILWHWAFQEGHTDVAPRRVRKLRPIARMPSAWTIDEVKSLLATAEALPGCFHRTKRRRSAWWGSLVRTAYDTGLRLADLLAVANVAIQDRMVVLQHKTGRYVFVQVRPATLAAIDQTMADESRELVWPLWCGRQTFYEHFKAIVQAAQIRPGTFRWLRRTAATQVETVQAGAGTALLGHASRSTTEQWYLDRSQLAHPPLPPW